MAEPYVTHVQACPRCGERHDVTGQMPETDGTTAFQRIICNACDCEYVEVYEYRQTEAYGIELCDRCGAPIVGDAFNEPVSGLRYCDICHDDLYLI